MTAIKRHKVLFDSSAAETGEWVDLDNRYSETNERAIQIDVTSGDTITIEGITKDVKGIDKSFLNSLDEDDITTLGSYTSDDNDVLYGPWTYIRVTKTGTTGPAKVQGYV